MAANLLRPSWGRLNSHELRILLAQRIGQPGQYDGREANPNRLYLPLAGPHCRVVLQRDGAAGSISAKRRLYTSTRSLREVG
jgi:hypothetical protein